MALIFSEALSDLRPHSFSEINSRCGMQLDQAPELWILQDWMDTGKGVNPGVLDMPVVC